VVEGTDEAPHQTERLLMTLLCTATTGEDEEKSYYFSLDAIGSESECLLKSATSDYEARIFQLDRSTSVLRFETGREIPFSREMTIAVSVRGGVVTITTR
jgi:hypothetical protein